MKVSMAKLKIKTIRGTALAVSLVTAVAFMFFAAMAGTLYWRIFLIAPVVFGASYFSANYFFNRFVLFRIKPIYQLLNSRSLRTEELSRKLTQRDDIMQEMRSELSRWAEKNAQEISRLKENEQYRKEFLGNVSHEIKTPVFTIQGYILTLLDGALEDETINRKYLERAEKSIDRLIGIVEDLEEISKLESGILTLQWERFDLSALAREIAEAAEIKAAKRGIRIKVGSGVNHGPVMVFADRKRIGQVLTNLIVNSINYGKEGGVTKVGFIDMFEKVLVEVSDNGMGIAQEDIPRIFERFYRVDKSRSREQGGTGLGLAIVKHILEAHNETITLRSTLGGGSTFSFTVSKK